MSGISKTVTKIIQQSPFLEEAIADKLINVSALARHMHSEVCNKLGREINEGAIVMAINRMEPGYYHKINLGIKKFFNKLGDFTVKSGINDYTFKNSETLFLSQANFFKQVSSETDSFISFSNGIRESTIIASNNLHDQLVTFFQSEQLLGHKKNLSAVTINLPKENTEISGVYYYLLKKLAWLGINVVEVISNTNEVTFLVADKDIDKTFSALMDLKR